MKNILYLLVCLLLLEISLYVKDYKEILIIENNIKNSLDDLESVSLENYEIIVEKDKCSIIYYRNSIFKFKFLKKIEYRVII